MCKIRGGRVIGVTSKEEKAPFVREAGADEVIVSSRSDIAKEARRITDNRGVNVVYDGVGKDTFDANLDSLAPAGYLVIYGQSSGYVPPFDIMRLQEKGSLYLTRANALPWFGEYPRYLQQLVPWIHAGPHQGAHRRNVSSRRRRQSPRRVRGRQISGRLLLLP